jgi:hypothetical protein
MRPFFLLILFLSAALPAARAEPQFTIEPVGGKVTAAWKGTADTKRQRVFLITGFFLRGNQSCYRRLGNIETLNLSKDPKLSIGVRY